MARLTNERLERRINARPASERINERKGKMKKIIPFVVRLRLLALGLSLIGQSVTKQVELSSQTDTTNTHACLHVYTHSYTHTQRTPEFGAFTTTTNAQRAARRHRSTRCLRCLVSRHTGEPNELFVRFVLVRFKGRIVRRRHNTHERRAGNSAATPSAIHATFCAVMKRSGLPRKAKSHTSRNFLRLQPSMKGAWEEG